MNKDQVKGVAKIVAGKIEEATGELIDSPELIVKGVSKQVAGKRLKGRGDVKETIKNYKKSHPENRPG